MTVRILVGDALSQLRTLPDESVHCVVTSPPYWGLRAYHGDTWEGGDPECDHTPDTEHQKQGATSIRKGRSNVEAQRNETFRRQCGKCGAKRTGVMIGLEPTFDEHLANLVHVFRAVRRVLRDDGTLWLNYGDAYSGGVPGGGSPDGNRRGRADMASAATPKRGREWKPKDLMMMPARVAMALQDDGWYLRSEIVWHKANPMPESVTDRPTCAHEKLFLLSKKPRYYYDAEAVRVPAINAGRVVSYNGTQKNTGHANPTYPGAKPRDITVKSHANLRNVWKIASAPYSEAHFATFPPALVEPCIKAGCPVDGKVLDPFGGAGTVGLVADRLARKAILIEISPEYAEMARKRIEDDQPLFADVRT